MEKVTSKKKQFFTRRKVIIGAVVVLVLTVAAGVSLSRSKSGDGVPVTTAVVEKMPLGESVFTTGRVQLADKQEFYAPGNKLVREILVKPGDKVEPGQVLGYLEAGEEENRLKEAQAGLAQQQAEFDMAMRPQPGELESERASYNQARVMYENATKNLERTRYLHDQGAVSSLDLEKAREEFAAAEANYSLARLELDKIENGLSGPERDALAARVEQARAGVELAANNLAKCVLTAEQAGTVLTVEASAGDYVSSGTRLITVGDLARLEVTAGVGESDSGRLEPGQEVTIISAALPEREFEGTVSEVSGAAVVTQTNNGQQVEVPVKVAVNSGDGGIKPGYTVDLKIVTVPERSVLAVPYEAILDRDGDKQVFVLEDGRAVPRSITTGLTGDLYIEVLDGLQQGERVILGPDPEIEAGTKVRDMTRSGGGPGGVRP